MLQISRKAGRPPGRVDHELDRVASMLAIRFPDHTPAEIAEVVDGEYARLSSHARIATHLIPLTYNSSHRRLAAGCPSPMARTA
ncbi:MAG: hypothetical protein HYZ38_09600 [Mycobacterium sp.]|nr:hypothetical protein [Mycobacterium sp.]